MDGKGYEARCYVLCYGSPRNANKILAMGV